MVITDRIAAFEKLGEKISGLSTEELAELTATARASNGWITKENILKAFAGIELMLRKEELSKWIKNYDSQEVIPKIVGIVMAGNIPMVGFHDLLCTLVAGHVVYAKLSSTDQYLMQTVVSWLVEIEPRFKKNIQVVDRLNNIDAVIATGSDNTSRYFEYYFREIPSIIRKNRTSVAIIRGAESETDFRLLGDDIFSYFGLGCRNVSKVFTRKGFDIREAFPFWEANEPVIHHHKYRNNYDYHKSIYLVNKTPHLDTGYLLVNSSKDLVSPISVLFHEEYEDEQALMELLATKKEKIQCTVGSTELPFGTTQKPHLWDYADDVDTMLFLQSL